MATAPFLFVSFHCFWSCPERRAGSKARSSPVYRWEAVAPVRWGPVPVDRVVRRGRRLHRRRAARLVHLAQQAWALTIKWQARLPQPRLSSNESSLLKSPFSLQVALNSSVREAIPRGAP